MADLKLNITGNADSGVAAMEDMGDAVGASVVKWTELVNVAKAAAKAVGDFLVSAVKAYADAERVQRQLTRAAGDYATALGEQADAMEALYNVDGDLIKQSQTLLAQWGGHTAATEEAEVAALNLASAMGVDLRSATELLIRNVESGGTGLAKMGIHFEATGQKGEDFRRAVEAINGKLGGAAAADADSLTGQLHAADLAFEKVKETIGKSITEFLEQTGAVNTLTTALRNLNEFIGNEGAEKLLREGERMTEWVGAQRALAEAQLALRELQAEPVVDPRVLKLFQEDVSIAQARVDKLLASVGVLKGGTGGGSLDGLTNKGMKDAAQPGDFFGDVGASWKKSFQETTEEQIDAMAVRSAEIQSAEQKAGDEYEALMREQTKEQLEARQKGLDAEEKMVSDSLRAQHALRDKASQEGADALAKQEAEWAGTAASIGNAFVSTLSAELEKLAEGGEFDVALFVGNILAAAFQATATAVGAAYGQGAIGSLVGNIGALGIQAGARGISANAKRARAAGAASRGSYSYHDGGWPRAHSGAWMGDLASDEVPIIAQTGERVLSRAEVHHMGGPAAVDSAARGRGGITNIFQVQALDAKSAAESFESEVGRGLKRARESGRGDVPALLGMGPR